MKIVHTVRVFEAVALSWLHDGLKIMAENQ